MKKLSLLIISVILLAGCATYVPEYGAYTQKECQQLLSKQHFESAMKGRVMLGMNEIGVRCACGWPSSVTTVDTPTGEKTQMIYQDISFIKGSKIVRNIVYLHDDKVVRVLHRNGRRIL